MLINTYLERREYKRAQNYIYKLPTVNCDKNRLQGNLYARMGEYHRVSEIFQNELMKAATKICEILMYMIDIALTEQNRDDARLFAEILKKITVIYNLWTYNGEIGYFQLYASEKNEEKFIGTLQKMIKVMKEPWNPSQSRLYSYMKSKDNEEGFDKIMATFIKKIKNDENGELSFLKDNKDFNDLMNSIIF